MINKLKTTSFWLGLSGAVVIVLDTISSIFNIELYSDNVQKIILAISSALVLLGFITKKSQNDKEIANKDELLEDLKKSDDTK